MTPQEQVYKEFEAKLVAHLKAMDKAGKGNFNDWLACQQVLLQMRQTQALETKIMNNHLGLTCIHRMVLLLYYIYLTLRLA